MFKEKEKILIVRDLFITGLFIYTILPFLALMLYNHPSSDDFTYANLVFQKGFFGSQSFWYINWSGRYIGTVVLSLNPLVFHSIILYKLMPFLLVSGLMYAFYFLIDNVFSGMSKKNKCLICFLFIIAYFYQMPRIVSGLYWFAGAGTYQLGNIFSLLMFGNLIKYLKHKKVKNLYFAAVFLFLLIGSNETAMFLMDILLFIILVLYHFSFKSKRIHFNRKHQNIFFILIGLAVVFSLIVILAPGNSVRATHFPHKYQLTSFKKAYDLFLDYWIKWTAFTFVMILFFISFIDRKLLIKVKPFITHPVISFVILTGITYSGFFPAFWSMGEPPPLRTVNVIYFFYLLLWMYFALSIFTYINNDTSLFLPYTLIIILLIVTGTYYLKQNNVKTAYKDWLSGRAKSYNAQLNKRYQMIQKFKANHKKTDTLTVPKLKNIPKTIFFKDFTSDNVKNWRNASYAKYYNIPAIKTKK